MKEKRRDKRRKREANIVLKKRKLSTTLESKKINKKPKHIRNIKFDDDDTEPKSYSESELCVNDDLDEVDPFPTHEDDICLICGQFGRNNEVWYRCNSYSKWAHAACSGKEKGKIYLCDYCC